mmetsp:Transcript_84584/g.220896  ORF Transcript_84584/g.220896 Transcript_84584/m.220896 type:complete len:309 (+) Transcript_84584:71-997(+)
MEIAGRQRWATLDPSRLQVQLERPQACAHGGGRASTRVRPWPLTSPRPRPWPGAARRRAAARWPRKGCTPSWPRSCPGSWRAWRACRARAPRGGRRSRGCGARAPARRARGAGPPRAGCSSPGARRRAAPGSRGRSSPPPASSAATTSAAPPSPPTRARAAARRARSTGTSACRPAATLSPRRPRPRPGPRRSRLSSCRVGPRRGPCGWRIAAMASSRGSAGRVQSPACGHLAARSRSSHTPPHRRTPSTPAGRGIRTPACRGPLTCTSGLLHPTDSPRSLRSTGARPRTPSRRSGGLPRRWIANCQA